MSQTHTMKTIRETIVKYVFLCIGTFKNGLVAICYEIAFIDTIFRFPMVFIFMFSYAMQSIHHSFGWCVNNNVKDFIVFKLNTRWQFYYLFLSIIMYIITSVYCLPSLGKPSYHKNGMLEFLNITPRSPLVWSLTSIWRENKYEFRRIFWNVTQKIWNRKKIRQRLPSVKVVWHSNSHLIIQAQYTVHIPYTR